MTLSFDELRQLQAQLQDQRLSLLASLRGRLHQADDPAEMAVANHFDVIDNRSETSLFNDTEIAQLNHEVLELSQLDAAVARMGEGSYGDCTACGEAIGLARLHAQPAAAMCLACQQESERHGH